MLVLGVCMLRFYPYNAMKQFGAARPVTGGPRRLGADPIETTVPGRGSRIEDRSHHHLHRTSVLTRLSRFKNTGGIRDKYTGRTRDGLYPWAGEK